MNPLKVREDEIGRKLAEAHETGELRAAANYGKPLEADTGWDQTPEEFRMGFKILKNAGVLPPEIEMFHERSRLRAKVEGALPGSERLALQKALSELEQRISLRLEALRSRGSL